MADIPVSSLSDQMGGFLKRKPAGIPYGFIWFTKLMQNPERMDCKVSRSQEQHPGEISTDGTGVATEQVLHHDHLKIASKAKKRGNRWKRGLRNALSERMVNPMLPSMKMMYLDIP